MSNLIVSKGTQDKHENLVTVFNKSTKNKLYKAKLVRSSWKLKVVIYNTDTNKPLGFLTASSYNESIEYNFFGGCSIYDDIYDFIYKFQPMGTNLSLEELCS